MKNLFKFNLCALLVAGLAATAYGQIQTAGNLLVDVDATGQPVGPFNYLTNNGTLGGVFLASNNGVAGVSNLIVALGGNGTHGVLMDGNQNSLRHYTDASGSTIVTPPAGLVGSTPVFSVEAWMYKATLNDDGGPVAWGNRSASGGNVACNWGRNAGWGGFSWQGSGYDHGWNTVPSVGSWHHLVWTYDAIPTATGAGTLRLYRDGVLDKTEVQTNAPNVSSANNIWLCVEHSNATTGTAVFSAGMLGKVRIWDGVLTDAEVLNNYNYEAAAFTNGTPAAALSAAPIHRYSFNLPPTNNAIGLTVPDTGSAAGAPAIIRGNANALPAAWPYFDGAQLVLPNYGANPASTNGYVDMPNGMLSSLSSSNGGPGQVSFELWVEPTTAATWSQLLYMGNASNGEITGTGTASGGGANGIVIPNLINTSIEQNGFRSGNIGNYTIGAHLIGSRKHIVVTWDEASNLVKIYHEGVQVGQYVVTGKMNSIVDVNNWLGRSGWNDPDAPANYREFRMYDRLLTPDEIRHDYLAGPADLPDAGKLTWNGNVDGNWNTTTYNWLADGISTNFADGEAVQFDDTAAGTTTVSLAGTLSPGSVTVANSTKDYTFTGPGKLSGAGGLTKTGGGTLTFTGSQANDYTGITALSGGTTVVTKLANGGQPSDLGAASANAQNLFFSGGTLSYQGPATAIDRGYFAASPNSTLDLQNNLTLSGQVQAGGNGSFAKAGLGTLTYTATGSNVFSGGPTPGYNVQRGTVVLDGSVGGQTNYNASEFWIGGTANYGANLIVSNASLISGGWVTVGRGNGSIGNLSTLTLANGGIRTTANGFSMGYDGLLPGNLARQITTLNGNSFLNLAGNANIGESTGSFGTLYLNDHSWLKCATPRLGLSAGATGAVYIASSAAYTNTGYMSIGAGSGANGPGSGGIGLLVVKDNGTVNSTGDFNVTDLANSQGELDVSNNATVLVNGSMYIGKGAGTVATVNQAGGNFLKTGGGDFLIGGNATAAFSSVGVWNLSDGYLSINGNFQPGAYGAGTFNQSGGNAVDGAYVSIGRYAGSVGTMSISGGVFSQTNTGTLLIVGEQGSGTLNVSGSGQVNAVRLCIGNGSGASGTVNLDGGTIYTKQVFMNNAGAGSVFNFNGGLLQAAADAMPNFMSGLSSAEVLAGGANIDTGTNNLTIAQDFYTDYTGGGLTKLGAGSLTLSGYLYYTGPTVVSSGSLGITTHNYGYGSLAVADGAALSLQVLDNQGATLPAAGLTLGNTTGSSLTFDLGSFGNPPTAPLDVTAGTVTANGVTTINIAPASSLTVGEIPLVAYGTLAGSGSFALGILPAGVLGYLTNDTANSPNFIGLVVTSVFQPRWEGLAGGDWDVQGTTNWLDEITGLPQYFYQGTRVVFDDQATGTTSVNLVTNVAPGGVLVSNSVLNYTISGPGQITGGGSLTKVGSGSVTINTTNNHYSGATIIDGGGTLASTVADNLGTNSELFIGTGTLSLGDAGQKFSSVSVTNGAITGGSATITAAAYKLDNGSVGVALAGGTLATFGTNTDLVSVIGGNTYTGRTYLAGSVLTLPVLANGGSPSGIGASSADPTNLVFAGGGLSYTGPAVDIDRGYTVEAGGRLNVSGDLTLNGPITATAGNFVKGGNATVTYAAPGTNILSRGGGTSAYSVAAGTVVLNGGLGTPGSYLQTNLVAGELWIGYDTASGGDLILTNTSLNVSTWLAVNRGNGSVGNVSSVSLYDSVMTVGNCSIGYDGGLTGNNSTGLLSLHGRSVFTSGAQVFFGESAGGIGNLNMADNSSLILNGGWFDIGDAGTGYMVMSNSAYARFPGDFNLGDVAGGIGTLDIMDNATNLSATLYVGKGANSVGVVNQSGGYMGRSSGGSDWRLANTASATGTYNLSGGVFEPAGNFQVGAYGTGYWNQSGGIANCQNYPSMGRYQGSTGILNISGGVFNQTGSGQLLIIGEQGTATLTVSNLGQVNCAGGLSIGHTATGIGTVNLDGGTLATRIVESPGSSLGGSGTLNFNGGVLQANADNANFMTGLAAANVLPGGAVIDSGSYSIAIGQPLLDGGGNGGLIKNGAGALALNGVNTYTGSTLVNAGTLAGSGTIPGVVQVNGGAQLAAGVGAANAQLTLNRTPVLNGTVVANISKNGGVPTADVLNVNAALNYSGALKIVNIGDAPLQVGDTFTVFTASGGISGAFSSTNTVSSGQVVTWNINSPSPGQITVASITAATPPAITNSVSGNMLTLNWPAEYAGWILQVQTNSLSVGLGTNWVNVPGSDAVNSEVITINPDAGSVFYRLVAP